MAALAQKAAPAVYAIGLFLLLKHEDSLRLWVTEVSRTTVHFLTRPPESERTAVAAVTPLVANLNAKLDALVAQMASRNRPSPWLGSGAVWVGAACGMAVGVVYLSGYSLGDLMYVTRRNFKATTDALKDGLHGLANALAKVRAEVLERIAVVETKVDATRDELVALVKAESGEVKADVKHVKDNLEAVSANVDSIKDGMDDYRKGWLRANRGLRSLLTEWRTDDPYRHLAAVPRVCRDDWFAHAR